MLKWYKHLGAGDEQCYPYGTDYAITHCLFLRNPGAARSLAGRGISMESIYDTHKKMSLV